MDVSWEDLRLLSAAIDTGSLTRAARKLGVGQATMSRRLAALEQRLGHVLFERSRRGITLTTAGTRLLPHLHAMSQAARQLQATAEALDDEPAGIVRIAVPPGVAADLIAPAIPSLRASFPKLRVETVASAHLHDLETGSADLAIRFVRPTSGDLVSRRLGRASFALLASPSFVRDLPSGADHHSLPYISWPAGTPFPSTRWLAAHVPDVDPVFIADDFLVQRAAAMRGVGVLIAAPCDGLMAVPVAHPPLPAVDVHLVLRRSLATIPRVRVLADFIAAAAAEVLD